MTAADEKPLHPDVLPAPEAGRARLELAAMVVRGRCAGDLFLDAFSRASTVALATNDAPRQ